MPTTRYGLSVRPSLKTRYGLTTSAASVMSNRKRYGLTTENRQIVSTLYPLTTERYSLRYGLDVTESMRASRREREFMATLVSPDMLIRSWGEVEAEYTDLDGAERIQSMNVQVDALQTTTRHQEHAIEAVPLENISLNERTYQAEDERPATANRIIDFEALLVLPDASTRNAFADVEQHEIDVLTYIEKEFVSEWALPPDAAERKPREIEAFLYDLEEASSPYKLVFEHRIETASRSERQSEAVELKAYASERLFAVEETFEHILEAIENRRDAIEAVEHVYGRFIKADTTEPVELVPLDPMRRLERTFETTEEKFTGVERVQMELVYDSPMTEAMQHENIVETELLPYDGAELLERIREIAPIEVMESVTKGMLYPVVFDGMDAFERLTDQREIKLVDLENVEKQAFDTIVDLVPIDHARRLEEELAAYLEELSDGDFEMFLVYESILEPAARRPVLRDVLLSGATTINMKNEPVEGIETPLDQAEGYTTQEIAALDDLSDGIRSVMHDMVFDDAEAAEMFREEREVIAEEWISVEPGRSFETYLHETEVGERERMIEAMLEMPNLARREKELLAQFEKDVRATRERILDATLEVPSYGERSYSLDAVLEMIDDMTREKVVETRTSETEEAERQAREAILIEGQDATRDKNRDVEAIPTEQAKREPVEEVEEAVWTYAERTAVYGEWIDFDQAERTIKLAIFTDHELATRKKIVEAYLEELEDVDEVLKTKKRIWLIQARANHWNALSHWKKTR